MVQGQTSAELGLADHAVSFVPKCSSSSRHSTPLRAQRSSTPFRSATPARSRTPARSSTPARGRETVCLGPSGRESGSAASALPGRPRSITPAPGGRSNGRHASDSTVARPGSVGVSTTRPQASTGGNGGDGGKSNGNGGNGGGGGGGDNARSNGFSGSPLDRIFAAGSVSRRRWQKATALLVAGMAVSGRARPANAEVVAEPQSGVQNFFSWFQSLFSPKVKEEEGTTDKLSRDEVQRVARAAAELVVARDGPDAVAKEDDLKTLRRLQREVFQELLAVKGRLDRLEHRTGLRGKPGTVHEDASSHDSIKAKFKGQVGVGAAYMAVEDHETRHARDCLELSGVRTGTQMLLMFEAPFRKADKLTAVLESGNMSFSEDPTGSLGLQKVIYEASLGDSVRAYLSPLGCEGRDVVETASLWKDGGLTRFASRGSALYQRCLGTAGAIEWARDNTTLSIGQFLSGWGGANNAGADISHKDSDGPLCASLLAQLTMRPNSKTTLAVTALNRYWPPPPSPSTTALHWSEMGNLILPSIKQPTHAHPISSIPTIRSTNVSRGGPGSGGITNQSSSHSHSHADPNTSSSRETAANSWAASSHSHNLSAADHNTSLLSGTHAGEESTTGSMALGTSMRSLGVALSTEMPGSLGSLGGWMHVDSADWLLTDRPPVQWSLSWASKKNKFGVVLGSTQTDIGGWRNSREVEVISNVSGVSDLSQPQQLLQAEAFARFKPGGKTSGFTLTPGLLHVRDSSFHTTSLVVRSQWDF
eukprot:jgi/Mesvir1/16920/Mv15781-RA.1